jgi:hypothetical protein
MTGFSMLIRKVPLHGIMAGVWCSVIAAAIIGPIFSETEFTLIFFLTITRVRVPFALFF